MVAHQRREMEWERERERLERSGREKEKLAPLCGLSDWIVRVDVQILLLLKF